MKIKESFLLKEVAGEFIVVPVGESLVDFSAMIVLNETAVFLWKALSEDAEQEELVNAVVLEFDIDKDTAEHDVAEFIEALKKNNMVA